MAPVRRIATGAILLLGLAVMTAGAHEMRPAYAGLVVDTSGKVDVEFRQPIIAGQFLNLSLQLSCPDASDRISSSTNASLTQRWTAQCESGGLDHLAVTGLAGTLTDLLVTLTRADGSQENFLVKPDAPYLDLRPREAPLLPVYLSLGIEHLLEGIDHVLFIIGLMLLVPGTLNLIQTITSFTIAHSITLALSTLDLVQLSQAPVEAAIALSIIYVAYEITVPGHKDAITSRRPWLVAFIFGLLHGLGFAGVLRDIGLPEDQTLMALLLFNIGIEIGQLIVIAAVVALLFLARRAYALARPAAPGPDTRFLRLIPAYFIGATATVWLLQRTLTV
ncbi:MAG: HupE/UreJ family protein [Pseudomonadota bacterium]